MTVYLRSLWLAALAGPTPALAEDTEDNAVTKADDAFGQAVGNERIGLYSFEDVRGFSPVDAGNTRIEGLYFAPAFAPNGRVVRGNTVRVGISAQGYPFPAPTGIVDYQLNLPEEANSLSVSLERAQFGGLGLFFEGQARITQNVSAFVGGHIYAGRNATRVATSIPTRAKSTSRGGPTTVRA